MLKLKLMYPDENIFDGIEIIEEQNKLGTGNNLYIQGPYTGIFKNKNKRVYPKDELDRDIDRYLNEMVKTNRSMGELNHSQCLTDTASILTEDGWKPIKDVKVGDNIYSLNPDTKVMELHPVTRKIDEHYSGKMFRVKGRNIDTLVTPNHKFPLFSRYGKFELVSIEEIYNNRQKYNKHSIPKTAQFVSDDDRQFFTLKGYSGVEKKGNYNIDPSTSSDIPMSTFVKFLGIWLAEGHVAEKTVVSIAQKKDNIKEIIRDLLNEFPSEMQWREYTNDEGTSSFVLLDYRLNRFLRENFGDSCYNKIIAKEFKNIDPVLLDEMIYYFNLGDGRFNTVTQGDREYSIRNIFSTSKQLILDFNEILLKSGSCGNITKLEVENDVFIRDRLIKAENCSPLYLLNIAKTNNIWLDSRFLSIEPEDYNGQIYCVTVENSNFYCMDNGKSHWTGNCAEVNPERAVHMVTKLEEDNGTWYGKSKILSGEGLPLGNLVRGLINQKVSLGVSTRSLGTLQEAADHNVVRNLHIVAWDIVADPSFPTAFVNGILESKEYVLSDKGDYEQIYEDFGKSLKTLPKHDIDNYLRQQIINFIQRI